MKLRKLIGKIRGGGGNKRAINSEIASIKEDISSGSKLVIRRLTKVQESLDGIPVSDFR